MTENPIARGVWFLNSLLRQHRGRLLPNSNSLTGYVAFYITSILPIHGKEGRVSPKTYLSYSAAVILQALDNGYQYGFDIMDITGLPSGTVYPALRRLEDTGLVDSKWERDGVAQRDGRPPRKYYELTPDGKNALDEAKKRYRLLQSAQPSAKIKPSRQRG